MKKFRRLAKQGLCCLLALAMCGPDVATVVSFAAGGIGSIPRYVDFVRPEALTIQEVGLASNSDASFGGEGQKGENEMSGVPTDKTQEAELELREPEQFYDYDTLIDEPDGILVQMNDVFRTYQTGEGEYTTVVGGYSGLYQDEDGNIREIDNTLTEAEDMEFETLATSSNASRAKGRITSPGYTNEAGSIQVHLPERMSGVKGVMIETDGQVIEMIPAEGILKDGVVSDNAIRYSEVFPGIDYQYTILGNLLKEDIILMEPGTSIHFLIT